MINFIGVVRQKEECYFFSISPFSFLTRYYITKLQNNCCFYNFFYYNINRLIKCIGEEGKINWSKKVPIGLKEV